MEDKLNENGLILSHLNVESKFRGQCCTLQRSRTWHLSPSGIEKTVVRLHRFPHPTPEKGKQTSGWRLCIWLYNTGIPFSGSHYPLNISLLFYLLLLVLVLRQFYDRIYVSTWKMITSGSMKRTSICYRYFIFYFTNILDLSSMAVTGYWTW